MWMVPNRKMQSSPSDDASGTLSRVLTGGQDALAPYTVSELKKTTTNWRNFRLPTVRIRTTDLCLLYFLASGLCRLHDH